MKAQTRTVVIRSALVALIAIPLILRGISLWADQHINSIRDRTVSPVAPPGRPYADLHNDALLWNRNLLKENSRGHTDIPRLHRGGIGVQIFSVVTQAPYGININRNSSSTWDIVTALEIAQWRSPVTWFSRRERALDRARQLFDAAQRSNGRLVLVTTREELQSVLEKPVETRPIAAMLSIEGGAPIEGNPDNVAALFQAGFRMISLSHFIDTDLGSSAHGEKNGGLTPLGRRALIEMAKFGIILDLAHASPALIDDALAAWKGPVMFSHTGVRAICDNKRNLPDEQLRAVAKRGGLIGIGFWPTATCGRDVVAIANSVRHAVKIAGVNAVALGSDFDGAVAEPFDASHFPSIAVELSHQGLSTAEIDQIMGGNARRFLLANLPANK